MTVSQAAQRPLTQAKIEAEKTIFLRTGKSVQMNAISIVEVNTETAPSFRNANESLLGVPYYLFTSQEDGAFVFVSGSDVMPAILGYGVDAQLSENRNEWPTSLVSWLDYVSSIEECLEKNPSLAEYLESAQTSTQVISPLMTTKWGQDWPYNLQCPEVNGNLSVTGCMATSISQVLNYHQWPTQFSGSYSYYSNGTLSNMNFSDHSFDYSKMLDSYTRTNSTEEQQQEVAELMHCVGHALSMGYSPEGSGAYAFMGPKAFTKFIGATKAATLYRNLFSLDEWNSIIQSELQAARPVVLNGQASSGGHSFVLDGVNADGFYHVNWGWNGQADGYFDVSILNPEDRGTGASASSDGFSGDQSIVVGLCNPADNPKYYTEVKSNTTNISVDKTSVTLGSAITFSTKAFNQSDLAFDGKVGVVIYDANDNEYGRYLSNTTVHIEPTSYESTSNYFNYSSYGEKTVQCAYAFPNDMPEGTYKAYLFVQPNGGNDWDIIRNSHTRYSYRTITVSGGNVTIANSSTFVPNITATSWNFNDGEELLCGASKVKIHLQNNGSESISGVYFLKLTNPSGKTFTELESPIVNVTAQGEGDVSFDLALPFEGTWKATLRVRDVCVANTKYAVGENQFTATYDATRSAIMSIEEELSTIDSVYSHGVGSFSVKIKNEGAAYDGTMTVRIFTSKSSTGSRYQVSEFSCPVQVGANTTETVTLTGELDINFSTGKKSLYGRVYYLKGEDMLQLSTKASTLTIYGNTAAGIEDILNDEIEEITTYDIFGRKISTDSSYRGIFIGNGKVKIVK